MTLYTLGANIRSLISQSENGELTPEILEELARLELSLEDKTDAYAVLIRESIAQQAAYTSEIDRLMAARKTAENAERSLKDQLYLGLSLAGVKRVDGPRFKCWLQRGPGSLEVTCLAEELPSEFQRVTITPDKIKLAAYIKAGGEVPAGVVQHEGNESVRIK